MEILYVCQLTKVMDHDGKERMALKEEYTFDSNFEICFDSEFEKLYVNRHEVIPSNFYCEFVSNVSCIIGNNGSGKTKKIDFLIDCLTKPFLIPTVFIVCEENDIVVLYKNDKFPQKIISDTNETHQEAIINFFPKYTIMLYSNVFNNQHYLKKRLSDNFIDLSSVGLLNETKTNQYENDRVLNFFRNEVKQQVDFSRRFKSNDILPFRIPETLSIQIIFSDDIDVDEPYYGYMLELLKNVKQHPIKDERVPKQGILNLEKYPLVGIFKLEIIKQVFITLLVNIYNDHRLEKDHTSFLIPKLNEFFNGSVKEDIIEEALELLKYILGRLNSCLTNKKCDYVLPYINFVDFLNIVKNNLTDFIDLNNIKNRSFDLKMNHDNSEKFLQCYFDIQSPREMFRFDWKMSSGEFALFSLFSRFNHVNKDTNDNVLVLIDEIDCLLHPKWQQKIVNYLVKSIPEIIKGKHLQFLITTHSPILLSDIPRSNVTFLTKKNSNNEVDKKHKETFGANISTIYFNSFALEQGSIGDFAKEKIDALIKAMVEVETDEEGLKTVEYKSVKDIKNSLKLKSQKEIELYINLIGEPIIRNKLLNLFEKCKGNDVS